MLEVCVFHCTVPTRLSSFHARLCLGPRLPRSTSLATDGRNAHYELQMCRALEQSPRPYITNPNQHYSLERIWGAGPTQCMCKHRNQVTFNNISAWNKVHT